MKRVGADVTIVAASRIVLMALEAAEDLSKEGVGAEGVGAEVVDPRTLHLLEIEPILASVRKTHHVVIMHEARGRCSIGVQIAAEIQENSFDYVNAPIVRVGNPNLPMTFSKTLEQAAIPDVPRIVGAVRRLLGEM